MIREAPRSTRTDTLLPSTTPCRSSQRPAARGRARRDRRGGPCPRDGDRARRARNPRRGRARERERPLRRLCRDWRRDPRRNLSFRDRRRRKRARADGADRSEEHTSELQSLMRISYAVFCLKKKTYINTKYKYTQF